MKLLTNFLSMPDGEQQQLLKIMAAAIGAPTSDSPTASVGPESASESVESDQDPSDSQLLAEHLNSLADQPKIAQLQTANDLLSQVEDRNLRLILLDFKSQLINEDYTLAVRDAISKIAREKPILLVGAVIALVFLVAVIFKTIRVAFT